MAEPTLTTREVERAGSAGCATGCAILFFGVFLVVGAAFSIAALFVMPGAAKLAALFPLIFVAIGAGGIWASVRTNMFSPEKMQAIGFRRGAAPQLQTNLPIPKLRTYMGRDLPVRLSMDTSQKGHVAVLLLATLFWNGIVGVFVGFALFSKEFDSIFWLILTPFILVGLVIFVILARQALIVLRVPDTVIEMTEEPVGPGESVRIMITQGGNLRFDNLTVEAVCEEKIAYRRGTTTYHEDRKIWSDMLLNSGKLEIESGRPFKQTVDLEVPADAMHSFHASNNEIVWKLVVKGVLTRWPDFEFVYPFRVMPADVRERVSWKRESLSP